MLVRVDLATHHGAILLVNTNHLNKRILIKILTHDNSSKVTFTGQDRIRADKTISSRPSSSHSKISRDISSSNRVVLGIKIHSVSTKSNNLGVTSQIEMQMVGVVLVRTIIADAQHIQIREGIGTSSPVGVVKGPDNLQVPKVISRKEREKPNIRICTGTMRTSGWLAGKDWTLLPTFVANLRKHSRGRQKRGPKESACQKRAGVGADSTREIQRILKSMLTNLITEMQDISTIAISSHPNNIPITTTLGRILSTRRLRIGTVNREGIL